MLSHRALGRFVRNGSLPREYFYLRGCILADILHNWGSSVCESKIFFIVDFIHHEFKTRNSYNCAFFTANLFSQNTFLRRVRIYVLWIQVIQMFFYESLTRCSRSQTIITKAS